MYCFSFSYPSWKCNRIHTRQKVICSPLVRTRCGLVLNINNKVFFVPTQTESVAGWLVCTATKGLKRVQAHSSKVPRQAHGGYRISAVRRALTCSRHPCSPTRDCHELKYTKTKNTWFVWAQSPRLRGSPPPVHTHPAHHRTARSTFTYAGGGAG